MNARMRLERDLTLVVEQLRRLDHRSAVAESIDRVAEAAAFDEIDLVQAHQRRDLGLLTRERLVERAGRLTAALERLDDGTYGACTECGGAIHAARLAALPEADRCVPCQERHERATVMRTRTA